MLTELIRSRWLPWPELPAEELALYRSGYIDGDPSMAEEALAVQSVTATGRDTLLVFFAEPGLLARVLGTVAYQIALVEEAGELDDGDAISAYLCFFASIGRASFPRFVAQHGALSVAQLATLVFLLELLVTRLSEGYDFAARCEYTSTPNGELAACAREVVGFLGACVALRRGAPG